MTAQSRPGGGLANLLCALSYTTSLALGERMEHGLRTAYIGIEVADALGLSSREREAIYYGALLKDVGCTACAAGLAPFFPEDELSPRLDLLLVDPTKLAEVAGWLSRNVPVDARLPERIARLLSFAAQCGPVAKEALTAHCEVAEMFARRLGFPEHVQHTLRYQWERWDGKGVGYGLKGQEVPLAARVLRPAQTLELTRSFAGPSAARAAIQRESGKRFDPDVAAAFLAVMDRDDFWRELERESPEAAILAMRPPTIADSMDDQADRVCEALGDLVDAKTPQTWGHSSTTAAAAEGIARRLGLSSAEQARLRRAALVHDVGHVAMPVGILAREGRLSDSECERFRLHPHYTGRVLERVEPLRELAADAAAHHEWVNGQGYPRQLSGEQIPLGARVLVVADEYARLATQQGDREDPGTLLDDLRPMVGSRLDGACYSALAEWLTGAGSARRAPLRPAHSNVLSEREIDVLRLLARGLSNPEIGRALVISRKTVEHHLEHIYGKLGVSCRTSAVVYAVQNGYA